MGERYRAKSCEWGSFELICLLKVEERVMESGGGRGRGGGYEGGVVMTMTRDPKPRLRWTADLHDRFIDAVTKLGGPDSM